ncbi:MAG: hypothetical protein ACTHKU_09400, partial [Verrucomicrobiota bacterium]
RRTAGLFYIEGRLNRVHPITSDAKTLRRFGSDWLTPPMPGQANAFAGVEVFPTAGFLFCAEMGKDLVSNVTRIGGNSHSEQNSQSTRDYDQLVLAHRFSCFLETAVRSKEPGHRAKSFRTLFGP